MTKLAHQVLDDDRVFVTVPGRSMSCHVTSAEARRFAWALLADLDPAEADSLGYVAPAIVLNGRCLTEDPFRGKRAWQLREILNVLRGGPSTCARIAGRLAMSREQTSVQLNRLQHRGHAVKAGRTMEGGAHFWQITADGRKWLADCEAEEAQP